MPVRFVQAQSRREARAGLILAGLIVAAFLTLLCGAPPTAAARWSAPARPAGCSAALPTAAAPSIVFPSADPTTRSGPGALLWSAPRGCAASATSTAPGEAAGATLDVDDLPGIGRSLAASGEGLAEVATATGTAAGQVAAVGRTRSAAAGQVVAVGHTRSAGAGQVAAAGGRAEEDTGALTEGRTAGTFGAARPLGGPATPVAVLSAYLGDVAIASPVRTRKGWAIAVRVQRHYSRSPAPARLVPVGAAPVEAVAATMDYRAELLLVWAGGGTVHARAISAAGALGPAHILGSLPSGPPDPELRALLSDDGHAIVAWRSQVAAPGGTQSTTIELSISGAALTFGAPRLLEHFRDLGGFVPPAGSLRLLRLSSEAVMIAWTGVDAGGYVVRASPVSLRRGAWAPVVISGGSDAGQTGANRMPTTEGQASVNRPPATGGQAGANRSPAADAVLADIAAGPNAEAFVLWRTAPRSTSGAIGRVGSDSWAIHAARGHYAGRGEVSFAAPELVSAPGHNGPPAVAVDPASGRALAAWVTLAGGGGMGHIEYALLTARPASASAPAVAPVIHTARRAASHDGIALVACLSSLAVLALAGALLLDIPRRPWHIPMGRN